MQSQLVCSGCRIILLYPSGATSVRCAICNTITSTSSTGNEMAHIVCRGCQTLLMYPQGASSVRCSCCSTLNLARSGTQVSQVNCSRCRTTLMFPSGAPSVRCAVCQYITPVSADNTQGPPPARGPRPATPVRRQPSPATHSPASAPSGHGQTVVVENPMSLDEHGKMVSNVVVGVATDRK